MAVEAKICGINSEAALTAAVEGGARHVGFVFYPPSPRALTAKVAAELAAIVPPALTRVGLFVDATDADIAAVLRLVPLDMLQLHGEETPSRARELRERFGKFVMKAIKVGQQPDVDAARAYLGAVDWLLFDAKPPAFATGALPGGNALSFDWTLMAGRDWPVPWMLAGGIDVTNVAAAVAASNAPCVDVSSGVEDAPGHKSAAKIGQFLAAVAAL